MNRRGLTISLVVGVLFALVVAWWMYTFEYAEEDRPTPLRGEARYNPFYGLKKVLQQRGIEVEARANLNLRAMHLGENDTLVLGADVRTLTHADAEELLDWADDGGHLVFALPQGSEGRAGELLDDLKISVVSHMNCVSWPGGEKITAEHCFAYAFKPKKETDSFDLLLGDEEHGYYIGRGARGDGDVTLVGDLQFLHTEPLKRAGFATFAWQVLAPVLHDGSKVHLVYAADVPPLHVLLVRYGWPALLPALLALLAWLWARAQRFGPLLPLAAGNRRALREHIEAAGEFTFRRGRGAALYAPLRRAFDERLRRDDPALAALEGDTLIEALAARSGHSPAVVRLALQPFNLAQPETFFTTIKTLTELRARP
jgi:hypothetical protein